MSPIVNGRGAVEPDGRCHSVHALLYGCDEPAPEGRWSCDRHAVAAWKRGQEVIAERELKAARRRRYQEGAPDPFSGSGRDRTASAEKVGKGRGWSS